jgi:hypothetical protein
MPSVHQALCWKLHTSQRVVTNVTLVCVTLVILYISQLREACKNKLAFIFHNLFDL